MKRDGVFCFDEALERVAGDRELLAELVGLFLEESAELVETLARAVEGEDLDATRQIAHRLKGSAAALSGASTRDAAAELESAAKNRDLAGARRAWAALRQEVVLFRDALAGNGSGSPELH